MELGSQVPVKTRQDHPVLVSGLLQLSLGIIQFSLESCEELVQGEGKTLEISQRGDSGRTNQRKLQGRE